MREEEKQPLTPDPEPSPEPAEKKPARRSMTKGQQQRQQKSVFQYIAILFAAAFILLLFTFFMERRQHQLLQEESQEQIDNLQQSVSAVQSLQNLYDENAALKETVAELEDQLEDAERQLDVLPDVISNQEHTLAMTIQAMDYFWQMDEAYVKGRYTLCRQLIQALEDTSGGKTPLTDYLPTTSTTDTDRFSPADRFQEIRDTVF